MNVLSYRQFAAALQLPTIPQCIIPTSNAEMFKERNSDLLNVDVHRLECLAARRRLYEV